MKPVYPLAKTVANLTLDILQTAGPAKDVMLVGDGQNDLEDRLKAAAAAQGRTVTPEALPERGSSIAPITSRSRGAACRRCC